MIPQPGAGGLRIERDRNQLPNDLVYVDIVSMRQQIEMNLRQLAHIFIDDQRVDEQDVGPQWGRHGNEAIVLREFRLCA